MFHSVEVYLIVLIGHIKAVPDCGHAEEGKEYSLWLNGTIQNRDKEVAVKRGKSFIAKCVPAAGCKSLHEQIFSLSMALAVGHQLSVNVKIVKTTRNDNKTWRTELISSESLIASCSLLTFSRPENVTCEVDEGTSGINITCNTTKIYPRAKCDFLVYVNEKKRHNDIPILYEHYEIKNGEMFFSSACKFRIFKEAIEFGLYEIKAMLTPEISKPGEEIKYGSIIEISFVIESPKVKLEDCPNFVRENSDVFCLCTDYKSNNKISSNSSTSYTIRWYNNRGDVVQEGNLLNFTANKTVEEYACEGTDRFGFKSPLLLYKPVLLEFDNHTEDIKKSRVHQIISVSSVASVLFILIILAAICGGILVKRRKWRKSLKAKERPMVLKHSEQRLSMESNHDYHVLAADHYDKCDPDEYDRSELKDELKTKNNLLQILNTEYITPIIKDSP
ncbi:polymorphic transmembrane cluster 2 transmembrane protein 2 [Biomphalaria pfeifferi]|uniref:Polymorphic transmembrane cluster 2 transmembrane protein 2 n=1 Tax=Biomphalaria pfeifferi TaxID=112525 RepID=A0AAD8C7E5_BIOPF|nr:polymorphic transmembrane cluster 2 transmembrane protein 2 [Biomphalaria pfeifferi]